MLPIVGYLAYQNRSQIEQALNDAYSGFFIDWGAAEYQKYPDKAFIFYEMHLKSMAANKGWSDELVDSLVSLGIASANSSTTAAQFWSKIIEFEPQIINQYGGNLRGYDDHIHFLENVADAAGEYRKVLDTYAPHNIVKETGKDTFEEFKNILIAVGVGLIVVTLIKK